MKEILAEKYNWSKFRFKQIDHAIYQELIDDWSEATALPREIREILTKELPLSSLKVSKRQESKKKDTVKVLFELNDGNKIETVLMKHDDRNTVCVSSQVGCPVGCTFCATGSLGLKRNLIAEEIVDQVLHFAREVKKSGQKIDNIVFMGMGEPMLNLENVSEAIKILTDDLKFAMGKRKITVSTSGYIQPLIKLLTDFPNINLAISLHAPNQKLREQIMPTVSKSNNLNELISTARDYANQSHRRISYEYILLEKVNDDLIHAQELARLVGDHLAHVNLIPYNPHDKNDLYKRPNTFRVNRFKDELNRLQIPVSVRVSMGDDIAAACGQLAGGKE